MRFYYLSLFTFLWTVLFFLLNDTISILIHLPDLIWQVILNIFTFPDSFNILLTFLFFSYLTFDFISSSILSSIVFFSPYLFPPFFLLYFIFFFSFFLLILSSSLSFSLFYCFTSLFPYPSPSPFSLIHLPFFILIKLK